MLTLAWALAVTATVLEERKLEQEPGPTSRAGEGPETSLWQTAAPTATVGCRGPQHVRSRPTAAGGPGRGSQALRHCRILGLGDRRGHTVQRAAAPGPAPRTVNARAGSRGYSDHVGATAEGTRPQQWQERRLGVCVPWGPMSWPHSQGRTPASLSGGEVLTALGSPVTWAQRSLASQTCMGMPMMVQAMEGQPCVNKSQSPRGEGRAWLCWGWWWSRVG